MFFSEPSDVQGARGQGEKPPSFPSAVTQIQSSVETHFGIFDNNRLLMQSAVTIRVTDRYEI